MAPQQQSQQQGQDRQQQMRSTSSYIAFQNGADTIHQFYLDALELRQLQANLIQLGNLFDHERGVFAPTSAAASPVVVSSLPSVAITDQDLLLDDNRECCICCAEYRKQDLVLKLPCGHLFHHACVGEWFRTHNSCPMCRWELETDDPLFELGRIERMKLRTHGTGE